MVIFASCTRSIKTRRSRNEQEKYIYTHYTYSHMYNTQPSPLFHGFILSKRFFLSQNKWLLELEMLLLVYAYNIHILFILLNNFSSFYILVLKISQQKHLQHETTFSCCQHPHYIKDLQNDHQSSNFSLKENKKNLYSKKIIKKFHVLKETRRKKNLLHSHSFPKPPSSSHNIFTLQHF